jgi:hypothetical protein
MGFDHPNLKSYRLLQQNGKIDTSRHVLFDESARPAADTRADFNMHSKLGSKRDQSPRGFEHKDVSDESDDSRDSINSAESSQAGTPSMSPVGQGSTAGSTSSPSAATEPVLGHHNPLFESEGDTSPERVAEQPPSHKLPPRANRGVAPQRYDPGAYASFTHGLPSKKRVKFAPDESVWGFQSQGSPLNPKH